MLFVFLCSWMSGILKRHEGSVNVCSWMIGTLERHGDSANVSIIISNYLAG